MPHPQQPSPSSLFPLSAFSASSPPKRAANYTWKSRSRYSASTPLRLRLLLPLFILLEIRPVNAFTSPFPRYRFHSAFSLGSARIRLNPWSLPASTLIMNEEVETNTKSGLPAPIKDKSVPLTDTSLKPFLEHIIAGASLSSSDVEAAFDRILAGSDPVQVGALLAMLRQRGETPVEIAGMVRAMLKQRYPVNVTGKLLDIVGTGGDGAHTINISTAAIILAAACGCKAAKLGNRSVSSKCGSADVLETLGIDMELTAEQVAECIETTGVGFMFAPVVHPTMKKVAPIRKALGVRTAFNIVGPLLNAAGAQHAVVGVFQERLLDVLAGTLGEIGTVDRALIIHGVGLDEISPLGPSTIVELKNVAPAGQARVYERTSYTFDPLTCGIPRCAIEDLRGGDAAENAALLRQVLSGGPERGAKRDAVVLNAAAGLYVYGSVPSLAEGVTLAYDILASGKALVKLDEWIACSQALRKGGG